MKIACPACNASGTLPDHEIPEEGRYLSCPRCKQGFSVKKPQDENNAFLVDTCPACTYSTFGEERFGSCPKCGVSIRTFVERQRDEQQRKREQQLLGRTSGGAEPAVRHTAVHDSASASVADFIEGLHPVNLIGWGAAAAAVMLLGLGLWGVVEFSATDYRAASANVLGIEEAPSSVGIFLKHGLVPWILAVYGGCLAVAAWLFLKRLAVALRALSHCLRAAAVLVPVYEVVSFVGWVMEPVPHGVGGYAVEIAGLLFMSALVVIPLLLLDGFLADRRVTSVVTY